MSTIAACLNEVSEHQTSKGYFMSGSLNNLKVTIYETGVSVKGSTAKFHLGDNLQTLTRSGMQQAIEHLSDALGLPMDIAKITAVDVATHWDMKYLPSSYYSYLGAKKHFTRLHATPNTLYYNTNAKQLIFYDKGIESTAKNVALPTIYQNANLLRYEMRYKGRLAKQFNINEITGATLYNDNFYIGIIDRWVKEYLSIDKVQRLTLTNMDNIKKPNEAFDAICGIAFLKMGQSEIEEILNDIKAKKTFTDPKSYTRLKDMVKKVMNKPEISEKSDLIQELDQNIKEIKQYYR
jgi:hypothetical protein